MMPMLVLGVVLKEPNPKDELSDAVLDFLELDPHLIRFQSTNEAVSSSKVVTPSHGVMWQ